MGKSATKKLESFFCKYTKIAYKKGETILSAEDEPRGVYYLKKGYVRLYVISEDGNELTFNIYKHGSYFPVIWALGGLSNRYYFGAMTNVVIYRAQKKKFVEFIQKDSSVLFELSKRLSVGLGGLSNQMEYLFFGSSCNRASSVLLVAGKRFGRKRKTGELLITLRLTHQDVAGLAGLTRETTSVELKKLERKGIISYDNRKIVIKDLRRLEQGSLIEGIDIKSSEVG